MTRFVPWSRAALICGLALPLMAANCGGKDDTAPGGETGLTGLSPDEFWEIEVLYGVANIDDDDENGISDWDDGGSATDNDLAILAVPAGVGDLALSLEGAGIRVWYDGAVLLDETTTSASLSGADAKRLGVEFAEPMSTGSLGVEGGSSSSIALVGGPITLNHHLQIANHLWVMSMSMAGYSNAEMVADLQRILGEDRVTVVSANSYGGDVWIQDELEFAYRRIDGHDGQLIVDSIRSQMNRYLDAFPENELQQPDVAVGTWGAGTPNSLDSFGNLETAPPVTVDGVDYPLGRIYYGGSDSLHPAMGLTSFLQAQQVQAPIRPDSSWLCVGHVDEFFTFLPDASSAKGFRMIVTDVDVTWALLDSLDPGTAIPQYQSAHGYSTIGELVGDMALRAMNEDIQRDHIEPQIEYLKTELGLDDADIVRVPGIWEENSWCRNYALALIPGLVNLAVFTEAEGDHKLLIADPFLRGSGEDQAADPYIALWDSLMPAGHETHYLDNWDVYHEGWGEVHCGTNIRRDMGADWWTEASHLMGAE